jgi:rhodanese-related sulfurtransferase
LPGGPEARYVAYIRQILEAIPMNSVTAVPAAPSEETIAHFEETFRFEADCWDVHAALQSGNPGFVLLDVRNDEKFAEGHVPGATHLPYGKIIGSKLARWPEDTLFVTYCDGPHCNGAARGAIRLAKLGRQVKIMIGGATGWVDEGFDLEREAVAA